MAVDFYAEVWPVPGTSPWVPRLDSLDWAVLSATKRNGLGSGAFQIPVGSSQLNQILYKDPDNPALDIESLIRVYRAGVLTPDYEFFADNAPNLLTESGLLQFSGGGIETEFDKLRVLPFDYPRRPTLDQHWLFGSDRNAVRNGGFEDNPFGITNPGFEDGTPLPWWAGAVDGVSASISVVTTAPRTGTFHLRIQALLQEGGATTTLRVVPNKSYQISFWGRTDAGTTSWQLGASGPATMIPGAGASLIAIPASPGGYEVVSNANFNTTYAFHSVTFTTAPDQTSAAISIRCLAAPTKVLYVDDVSSAGFGIGVAPWQAVEVVDFGVDNSNPRTGTWAGEVTGMSPQNGFIYQILTPAQVGVTYTVTAYIGATASSAGTLFALNIRDLRFDRIAQVSHVLGAAGSYTEFQVTFVTPDFLPGTPPGLQLQIVNEGAAATNIWVDDVTLIQGQAATTVGDIMQQLMDDINVNHVAETPPFDVPGKPWLTYTTFTAVLDSNGAAWNDPEISMTIREGTRYSDVLNAFVRLGYEWELVPDPVTDGEWELKIYNPGGKGSVLPDEIGLVAGSADIGGPVSRSRMPSNWLLTRGSGGVFDVTQNAASLGAVQFQMGYSQALDIDDDLTAAIRGADQMAENIDAGIALQLSLAPTDPDQLIPGRDFTVGDALAVTVPGVIVRGVRRCESHTVTLKADPGDEAPLTFVVSFLSENYASGGGGASIGGTDNRIARGLELVMRKLERTEDPEAAEAADPIVVGGKGGEMTYSIAAANASESSKGKADFICTGANDHVVFSQVEDLIRARGTNEGGKVRLSEGLFVIGTNQVTFGEDIWLDGSIDTVISTASTSGIMFTMGSDCKVSNLTLAGPVGFNTVKGIQPDSQGVIDAVHFAQMAVGIELSGNNHRITNCWANICPVFVDGSVGSADVTIDNCTNVGTILLGQNNWSLTNLVMFGEIIDGYAGGASGLTVVGIIFNAPNGTRDALIDGTAGPRTDFYIGGIVCTDARGFDCIWLDGWSKGTIADVQFDEATAGILLENCTDVQIEGGILGGIFLGEHGIHMVDCQNCKATGTIVHQPGQDADDTFDGVHVSGGDRCDIRGVTVIAFDLVAPQPRSAVNIASGTNHIYLGNDAYVAARFATAPYIDAGTATINTWPAAAAPQGDNLAT